MRVLCALWAGTAAEAPNNRACKIYVLYIHRNSYIPRLTVTQQTVNTLHDQSPGPLPLMNDTRRHRQKEASWQGAASRARPSASATAHSATGAQRGSTALGDGALCGTKRGAVWSIHLCFMIFISSLL